MFVATQAVVEERTGPNRRGQMQDNPATIGRHTKNLGPKKGERRKVNGAFAQKTS